MSQKEYLAAKERKLIRKMKRKEIMEAYIQNKRGIPEIKEIIVLALSHRYNLNKIKIFQFKRNII